MTLICGVLIFTAGMLVAAIAMQFFGGCREIETL